MKNFDPLIRREFEKLGINIIANDDLADLVVSKVRRQRFMWITLGVLLISLIASITFLLFAASKSDNFMKTVKSISFSQQATNDQFESLPQAGYVDVDTSRKSNSRFQYVFELKQGWIIQSITDIPSPIPGEIGKVNVYRKAGTKFQLVQQYSMSSRTQINEFGVPIDGIYRFEFNLTTPNFQGRVRLAIVRSL